MNTYEELNQYLNELFIFLNEYYDLFVDHLSRLVVLNDKFCDFVSQYDLSFEMTKNKLTYEEVYLLAREIIESINKDYLNDFDKLIENGELDFGYEDEYNDSMFKHNKNYNIINIKREFNYADVTSLVHEYIHYTNGKNEETKNRHFLTEFLSIYFELYTTDYLIDKGINKEEIDYKMRLLSTKAKSKRLFNMESPLLTYIFFGQVNDENYELLNDNIMKVNKNQFSDECNNLLTYLKKQEKNYNNFNFTNDRNKAKYRDELGYYLAYDIRYIIGTMLAFYARKYCNIEDIIWINDNINEFNGDFQDIMDKLNIDLYSNDFIEKMENSISDYIEKYDIKKR